MKAAGKKKVERRKRKEGNKKKSFIGSFKNYYIHSSYP